MRGKVASYIQIYVKTSSPSNHMALELRLSLPQYCQIIRRPRHLWAKTDWSAYDIALCRYLSNLPSPQSAQDTICLASIIGTALRKAIDAAVPFILPEARLPHGGLQT
jgi:hypothetical protein